MPYPPFPARTSNFTQDANNGLESPSPSGVDTEFNSLLNVVNQVVLRHRAITTAEGALKNVATATAQALAGTQDFTATASQTAFTTTIPWVATFTSLNVFVYVNNVKLSTSAVTVANSAGFLQVTIAAQTAGNIITVAAFESGAGLLTRLQTISASDGATLVAINDAGGVYTAVTVEAALQEVKVALNNYITAVGATADLIKRTGTVPFTANQSLGGFRLTSVADGINPQDAVTVNQFNAYTTVWNALQTYFMRLDGTTAMAASLPMGNNKITSLLAGTNGTDAVNKTQLDAKVSKAGDTMTGALNMGSQLITNLANPVAETDAINLATARTIASAFSSRAQYTSAGTSPFVVPAGLSKIRVRMWGAGGGGGSGDTVTRFGGGGGAYVESTLPVTAAESLTLTVGAGGAAGVTGGDTIIQRGATELLRASGGVHGNSTGLGGTYTVGVGIVAFGINGGIGRTFRMNTGAGEPTEQTGGTGGSAPNGGQGGNAASITQGVQYGACTAGEAPGGGGGGTGLSAAAGAAGRIEIEY